MKDNLMQNGTSGRFSLLAMLVLSGILIPIIMGVEVILVLVSAQMFHVGLWSQPAQVFFAGFIVIDSIILGVVIFYCFVLAFMFSFRLFCPKAEEKHDSDITGNKSQ